MLFRSAILPVREWLLGREEEDLRAIGRALSPCTEILERIKRELRDNAPMLVNQGGVICDGIDAELDELRAIAFSGKDYLVQLQQREIARTGIQSLKVSYNKVFGYYLEVSNANKDKVPSDWIRKQTLVNAERYITEELKVYEEEILHAEEKLQSIELRMFNALEIGRAHV